MKREELLAVIECAELAPSVHNTQPWSFSADDDVIRIRADRGRGLDYLDPHARELTISCGAAVEFAYLAVRALGRDCLVRLLPARDDKDLFAVVEVGGPRPTEAQEQALFEAIPRRYTDRGTYVESPIPADLMAELEQGVSRRGGWLRVLDREGDRLAVIQALTRAETAEAADPAYREELAAWLRVGAAPDGVPLEALDGSPASMSVTDVPRRDFTGGGHHPHPGAGAPPVVERDALLLIGTDDDDVVSWLGAGRALGWLLLRLTVAGLSSQPLAQTLDIESTSHWLAHELGLLGHIQFLLRTGQGHGHPTTGRRHVVPQE